MQSLYHCESDNQEGFFAETGQTNSQSFRETFSNSQVKAQSNVFEARYLSWTGQIKKQPFQAFQASKVEIGENNIKKMLAKETVNAETQDHPYWLYETNKNYQLVYQRFKGEPITKERHFMSTSYPIKANQVKLEHVGSKTVTENKKVKQFQFKLNSDNLKGRLTFDSKFECGNLHCAYKKNKIEQYILFIQNDTNSLGYNQWFYFSVQGAEPGVNYNFKIVNFKKKHSFFRDGCKPAVFSLIEAREKGHGWSRKGQNVTYGESPIQVFELPNTKFYCLNFSLSFPHKNDYCLISMGLPYSYTKLTKLFKQIEKAQLTDPPQTLQIKLQSVCKSLCGNDIPQLTLTRKSQNEKKKMIIIMARQHPGEVWSSYMAEGMIRSLIDYENKNIVWLLENYIIKIYPMVNVDGVIYGNFRCDITGTDLNRRWKFTSRTMFPQISEIKRKVCTYKSKHKIDCVLDLHGHSKSYNVFSYCCKNNQLTCRVLSLLISKINPTFHFPSCTFGLSKFKETTARATIYRILKSENVLTIESSFFGSRQESSIKYFEQTDIFEMGKDILIACQQFFDKKSKVLASAKAEVELRIAEFTQYDKKNKSNSGSESQPSVDDIDFKTKINNIFNKDLIDISELSYEQFQKKIEKVPIEIKLKKDSVEFRKKVIQNNKPSINPVTKTKEIFYNRPSRQSITIERGSLSFIYNEPKRVQAPVRTKKTISYSQQKSYDLQNDIDLDEFKQQDSSRKQRKIVAFSKVEPKSQRKSLAIKVQSKLRSSFQQEVSKPQINLQIKSEKAFHKGQNKFQRKSLDQVKFGKNFIQKFQNFVPTLITAKQRFKEPMFQQTFYNEDQGVLVNMLVQNKKRIDLERIRRNVEQQANIAQRQGKSKSSNQKEKIIDFRTFKHNEKVSKQIKRLANFDSLRYQ